MRTIRVFRRAQVVVRLLTLACMTLMPAATFALDMMVTTPETVRSGNLELPIALPSGRHSPAINRFVWVPLTGGQTQTLVIEVDSADACPEMLVPTLRLTGLERSCVHPIYDPNTHQFLSRSQFAATHGMPVNMTCREALSVEGAIVYIDSHTFGGCLRIPSPLPDILRRDSDGDGTPDHRDAFPQDNDETTDSDGDGFGDNADPDDDNDGVNDDADDFPYDSAEWEDSDGDGTGNNADSDDDDDRISDIYDAFPTDPTRSVLPGDPRLDGFWRRGLKGFSQ